jgi:hypothetical protein
VAEGTGVPLCGLAGSKMPIFSRQHCMMSRDPPVRGLTGSPPSRGKDCLNAEYEMLSIPCYSSHCDILSRQAIETPHYQRQSPQRPRESPGHPRESLDIRGKALIIGGKPSLAGGKPSLLRGKALIEGLRARHQTGQDLHPWGTRRRRR